MNNPRLKKAGVRTEYTEEQVLEINRCMDDIEYFCKNYVKLVHVDRGLISFEPYPYQIDVLKAAIKERYTILKFPRQAGKTTSIVALMLWYAIFNEHYAIAILANKSKTAMEILHRIKLAYENLPLFLQQGIEKWNEGSIEVENGSSIKASATSGPAIRGQSLNLVYLDEFATVPNNIAEEFFNSVFPTISSGKSTKVIISSTPFGLNMFYKLWTEAKEKRNGFFPISVEWDETPGRDKKFKEDTIKATSLRHWEQEYETEFLGSSATLISGKKLRELTYITAMNGENSPNIRIYDLPQKNHIYLMIVDTAEGIIDETANDHDYSAFIIFDITNGAPYKISLVYKNNEIPVTVFPNVIYEWAKKYNDAYILPEVNNNGKQIADILHDDLEYENIIVTANKGTKGLQISGGFGERALRLGLQQNKLSKSIGCANLKAMVEADQLIIQDYWVINELSRFVQKRNTFKAEREHDDLAMCCVIFAWAINQQYIKDLNNSDFRKSLLIQRQQMVDQDLVPFGIIVRGNEVDLDKDLIITLPDF
jgi:hypothetical protein